MVTSKRTALPPARAACFLLCSTSAAAAASAATPPPAMCPGHQFGYRRNSQDKDGDGPRPRFAHFHNECKEIHAIPLSSPQIPAPTPSLTAHSGADELDLSSWIEVAS